MNGRQRHSTATHASALPSVCAWASAAARKVRRNAPRARLEKREVGVMALRASEENTPELPTIGKAATRLEGLRHDLFASTHGSCQGRTAQDLGGRQ